MGSPSRNVQYHPPRLSEDRLNLAQPHSPSLPTHCTAPGNRECARQHRPLRTGLAAGDRCKGRRFGARRMYVPGILSSQPSQACLPSHGTVPERRVNVQKGARLRGTDRRCSAPFRGSAGRRKDAGTRWLGCCPPEMSTGETHPRAKRPMNRAKTPLRRRAAPIGIPPKTHSTGPPRPEITSRTACEVTPVPDAARMATGSVSSTHHSSCSIPAAPRVGRSMADSSAIAEPRPAAARARPQSSLPGRLSVNTDIWGQIIPGVRLVVPHLHRTMHSRNSTLRR